MRLIMIAAFILFLVSNPLYNDVSRQKRTANRVQPGDLTYLGAFRLPDGVPGSEVRSWAWGGFAMTYYPGGNPGGPNDGYPGSIFATGHAWEYQVCDLCLKKFKRSKYCLHLATFPGYHECEQPGDSPGGAGVFTQTGEPNQW
jgi:hypothetical protein